MPDIAKLSADVATLYGKAEKLKGSLGPDLKEAAEGIWVAIQERAAFSGVDAAGKQRLGVVGGYPHLFGWRWARPSEFQARNAHRSLFSYPLANDHGGSAFEDLYERMNQEIKTQKASPQAEALHSLLVDELQLPQATFAAINQEAARFTSLIEKYLVPQVKAREVDAGLDALASAVAQTDSKFIRAMVDPAQRLRFWRIHLEYFQTLLK